MDGLTLRYVQTPLIEKALHSLDMRVGGKFDFESQMPSVTLKRKYLVNSLMEEAIASSQLVGAATTRVVAKQMLRENRKPKTPSEQMILLILLFFNLSKISKTFPIGDDFPKIAKCSNIEKTKNNTEKRDNNFNQL